MTHSSADTLGGNPLRGSSVLQGGAVGAGEDRPAVHHREAEALMDHAMVPPAQKYQVREVRLTAVHPVANMVCICTAWLSWRSAPFGGI